MIVEAFMIAVLVLAGIAGLFTLILAAIEAAVCHYHMVDSLSFEIGTQIMFWCVLPALAGEVVAMILTTV